MFRSRFLWGVLLVVLSVVILSGAALVSAQGVTSSQDAPEPGLIGVKGVLESGTATDGVFENGVTAYLYAFEGSAGDSVTISMTQDQSSDLDPFLVLLGPNGEMVASDDDSGTDVIFSALIDGVELPDDGVYLVLATSFVYIDNILVETAQQTDDQEANNAFVLTLEGNTPPTDTSGDTSTITVVPVTVGDTVAGDSTVTEPVGYFTLDGSAGDVISISAESDEFDTVLHVFGPNGDRIAVNDDTESGNTNSTITDLELPDDGTYLILATNVFFYNAGTSDPNLPYSGGKYTVSIQ